MIAIYISLILLASIPLLLTLKRICKYYMMARNGIKTQARIIHIQTQANYKSGPHDNLTLEYLNTKTNRRITGHAATVHNKYRLGDLLDVSYEIGKPKIYIKGDEKGYIPGLLFAIAVLAFVLFAVTEIMEMVKTGY